MTDFKIRLVKPHEGQKEVVESQARFGVVACGRRFRKDNVSH